MKPFDLQKALAGAKVVTLHGKAVNNFVYFSTASKFKVIAQIEGDAELKTFTESGKYSPDIVTGNDLFMATTKKTGYINIYYDWDARDLRLHVGTTFGLGLKTGDIIFATKELADENALPSRIAVATFEYED